MRILLLLVFGFLFLMRCSSDVEINTLEDAIIINEEFTPFNELIACAASNTHTSQGGVDIFFYSGFPVEEITLYLTDSINVDPSSLSEFLKVDELHQPLFNGFMGKFYLPEKTMERWARISYKTKDTLWYCKPILLKHKTKGTDIGLELLNIQQENGSTLFSWKDDPHPDNIIYFQLITDDDNNVYSATYTVEKNFIYNSLDNVVLNLTPDEKASSFIPEKDYKIILMGVTLDNWVNLLIEESFTYN